tara:strand:- start:108 stop:485 length:378 start_codon:yes stop_codon:yes gene_type:complete
MKIINIENFNIFKEIFEDNNNDYVIINIGATWCKPCNNIKEELRKFIEDIKQENSIFLKIDYDLIEEDDDFLEYIDVKKIPYFYIFKDKIKLKEFQTGNIEVIKNEISSEILNNNSTTFNLTSDF